MHIHMHVHTSLLLIATTQSIVKQFVSVNIYTCALLILYYRCTLSCARMAYSHLLLPRVNNKVE